MSPEGETIELKSKVKISPETPPELWLNRLDLSIKETLKAQCVEALGLPQVNYHDVNQLTLNDSFELNTSYNRVKTAINPYAGPQEFY